MMKKLLATALCVVMMVSLCTFVYADGETTVTLQAIHENEEYATWTWTSLEAAPSDITIRVDDTLIVSATLPNGDLATFFTYAKGAENFDNSNIQFVSQGTSGNVIAEFMPRDAFVIDEDTLATGSVGEFIGLVSGEGMSASMAFNYTVTGSEPVNAEAVVSSNEQYYGMRFVFKQFHNDTDEIIKYGAYIIPESLFDGGYDSTAAAMLDKDIENGETYSADILDIPLDEKDTSIIAIPYMAFKGETAIGTYVYGTQAVHKVSDYIK